MAENFFVDETDFVPTEQIAPALSGANIDFSVMARETSEQTIQRALSSYELGAKLRQLRLRKKIALTDLAKHTGLSASMLSQLETSKMVPTLPTLTRIAMVFDVGLEYFFESRKRKRLFNIVRAEERIRFPERADLKDPAYLFECLAYKTQGKALEAYLAEFPVQKRKDVREHYHEGSEFLFVVEGSLAIYFQEEEHTLAAGDSVYFDASESHGYCGIGEGPCRAVVITVPPRL